MQWETAGLSASHLIPASPKIRRSIPGWLAQDDNFLLIGRLPGILYIDTSWPVRGKPVGVFLFFCGTAGKALVCGRYEKSAIFVRFGGLCVGNGGYAAGYGTDGFGSEPGG
jgi:hypothetical protein